MTQHLPSFDLTGQSALVTGAARGIGRATALALAAAGADVALGLRVKDSAPDLVAEIEGLGRRCLALQMDVTSVAECDAAVADTVAAFGQLDILVNNAGFAIVSNAEDVTEEEYDAPMAVNVRGAFFAARAAGRHMIGRKAGCIVNVGSQAGRVALPGVAVYCMSKAAVDHMTRCLAVEWGPHNVRVNAIAPTFIMTDGTRPYLEDPDFRAQTLAKIPLGRTGEPLDVVGAIVFLASPAARMITGASLLIDGGWTSV